MIRVSPVLTATNGNDRIIQFGCWLKDEGNGLEIVGYSPEDKGDGLGIRSGQVVVLSLWARMSAPPERAELFIQDKTETWQCNRASMESTLFFKAFLSW